MLLGAGQGVVAGMLQTHACSKWRGERLHLCGGGLKHVLDEGLADGQHLGELALDLHTYTSSTQDPLAIQTPGFADVRPFFLRG